MDLGTVVVTESGKRGRVMAMRSSVDGLYVKIDSLAADWERVASVDSLALSPDPVLTRASRSRRAQPAN